MNTTPTLETWKRDLPGLLERMVRPPDGENRTVSSRCGPYYVELHAGSMRMSEATLRLIVDLLKTRG